MFKVITMIPDNKVAMPKITVNTFTEDARVKACLTKLRAQFPPENPLIISDVIDDKGHQYVNLVQKGGGVLGVALVGYTYILEQMGIRFIRLAGTSAGAINTGLMAAIGNKQSAKSEVVLDAICNLKFIELVDGHPAAKWFISKFITNKHFIKSVKNILTGILGLLGLLIFASIVFLGLQHTWPWASVAAKVTFIGTALLVLFIAVLFKFITSLLKRLKNSGFGINPGDFFYDWIKEQLELNGVKTIADQINKAAEPVPGLKLRVPNPEGINGLEGDVTFICSELVSQNKIQFPEMWDLFRHDMHDENTRIHPAGFIQASMSIPVFFESYFINDIPYKNPAIIQKWEKRLGESHPPSQARFVDGGILSNFPINLFYNSKVTVPRLPSFGIDLDDSEPDNTNDPSDKWSFINYFGRIFNTIRAYYDKDFLIKNAVYKKGIGTIKLQGYNWLNFFLTDKDKVDMFARGAEAATEFLISFDWEDYKTEREKMKIKLDNQTEV